MPPLDIPKFLQLSQEERREAWEKHRLAAKALPPEASPVLRRITTPPGVQDVDTDDNA